MGAACKAICDLSHHILVLMGLSHRDPDQCTMTSELAPTADGKWVQPNPTQVFNIGGLCFVISDGTPLRQILTRFLFTAQLPTYSLM